MWENIGKKVQAFVLIFIIALLSLVMGVVGFGNPSGEGCSADGPGYAAQVYGETISEGEFRAAYVATRFSTFPAERAQALRLREYTLDGLIERELLVREADRLGLQADPDEVILRVARDEVVLLGGPIDAPDGYPAGEVPQQSYRDREGNFSRDYFERFVQNYLRRSIDEFVAWQVAETRANLVREMVTASVGVSPREIWDAYVQENDRAQLSYVRFDPAHYRPAVELTDEAVGAWMAEHAEDVDAEYRRQRHRYTNLDEQTRARHILIQASEEEGAEREQKRALAEGLLQQLRDGADFAALAREHSTDEGSARRGGDLGWFPRGRMVDSFETAAFDAEPDTLVDHLVESRFGFHIIEVQGHRSGDVPEDEAKREIAEGLFREARAGELAREDADRALAYLRDGHTPEELDERLLHGWEEPPAPVEADGDEEATDEGAEVTDDEPEEPAERDARAPQVRETLNFGRAERAISGPFDSGPLTQAAFEMTLEDPLPEEPIELGDSWFVYQLISRTTADEEGFDDANRERLRSRLVTQKRHETLSAYIGRLRASAEAEGAIRINTGVLSYGIESDDAESDDSEETASL